MRRLLFKKREVDGDTFINCWLAFCTSKRTPNNIAEIPTVGDVKKGLQSISEMTKARTPNGVEIRILKEKGGHFDLDDVAYDFLKQAVMPPAATWPNNCVDELGRMNEILSQATVVPENIGKSKKGGRG